MKKQRCTLSKNDDITLDYIKIPYLSENMTEDQKELLEKELISIYKSMDGSQTLQKLVAENEMLSPYFPMKNCFPVRFLRRRRQSEMFWNWDMN